MASIITQIYTFFNGTTPTPKTESKFSFGYQIGEDLIRRVRIFIGKFFNLTILLILIFIAFFAGRTVKFMEQKPAFYFESLDAEQNYYDKMATREREKLFGVFQSGGVAAAQNKTIVASKGGKKYYYVWCKGAENIKEKNKRYFADETTAQQAGYTKAASCK